MRAVLLMVLMYGAVLMARADATIVAAVVHASDGHASRDVWVVTRRLRRGATVRCDDLQIEKRSARFAHTRAVTHDARHFAPPCDRDDDSVALRELSRGDVVRNSDIGRAPDVMAGQPVSLSVVANAIRITTHATALEDAVRGDRIDVRLAGRSRILSALVTGRGTALLVDPAP